MNKIKDKIPKLEYYQGEKLLKKTFEKKKSGRKHSLSPENCLFLT